MENLPKKISLLDKIRNIIKEKLGYREGERFVLGTKPKIKTYSQVELLRIASIEEKLQKVLNTNQESQNLQEGIEEKEAISLLEWVVQNARENFVKDTDDDILEDDLGGCCGLGQGITATTLRNMGLSPDIVNVSKTIERKCRHSFLAVDMPVRNQEGVQNKFYLVDTTFRQFFLRIDSTNSRREFIKDKRFGNKVASSPGYWMLQMENGEALARKILEDGFVELTEENAKMYGDSFILSEKERKDSTQVPGKEELYLPTKGIHYIQNIRNIELQQEIDYSPGELEEDGFDLATPLMRKKKLELNPHLEEDNLDKAKDKEKDKKREEDERS